MNIRIPFNKPYVTGKEYSYIQQSIASGKISGDSIFTKKCHRFFEEKYGFGKCLLTTSCTDALEMAALLIGIEPGDEVIMPSYTFVSTANAFVLRGAKIVFADSRKDHPGIDEKSIENLVTCRTKAIVPVHYAGVACDMDSIMRVARAHNLFVIEDAAQAIDSYYVSETGERRALGSIGHLAAFSFHETKNIISGEGGMLVVNDKKFEKRAEIIREKGTNRSAFFRGEVDKYNWIDVGSSFLPSDIIAAFLYAQLEEMPSIQRRRGEIWNLYNEQLVSLKEGRFATLPYVPERATNNYHMFYLVLPSIAGRDRVIAALKAKGILSIFHYLALHNSPFCADKHDGRKLLQAEYYTDCLLRLPLFVELTNDQVLETCAIIRSAVVERFPL